MNYLLDILLCSTVSILVFIVPMIIFFIVDFTIYSLTGKCVLHTIYKLFSIVEKIN